MNLDSCSSQLAARSTNNLCVNSLYLTAVAHGTSNETTKNLSDGKGSANMLLLTERSQKQFHGKNATVFVFRTTGLASTIFTFASVVLKLLQEGFTLTPCFPVLHALFKNLSVSVTVQLSCDRSICRYLFDRGKLSAVSCVSFFVQEHASEQKETAMLHKPSVGKATVVPATACASSLKQLHVASTFGSKNITWEAVAMRLSSSDALDARNGFKELFPVRGKTPFSSARKKA